MPIPEDQQNRLAAVAQAKQLLASDYGVEDLLLVAAYLIDGSHPGHPSTTQQILLDPPLGPGQSAPFGIGD